MNRPIRCCVALGFAAAAAFVFAAPEDPPVSDDNVAAAIGRFTIDNEAWERPILLDTATGDMWTLEESTQLVDGRRVAWIPMTRISSPAEMTQWQQEAKSVEDQYLATLKAEALAKLAAMKNELGDNHPDVLRLETEIKEFPLYQSVTEEQLEAVRGELHKGGFPTR